MSVSQDIVIKQLMDELEQLRFERNARYHIDAFTRNLGIQMALTPWEDWTDKEKTALRNAFAISNSLLHEYKNRLPKKETSSPSSSSSQSQASPPSSPPAYVYVVFKEGVYRQECGGIFTTREAAVTAAKALLLGERDDYHTYEIIAFPLNKLTEQGPLRLGNGMVRGGELQEPPVLDNFCRKDGKIV